MFKYGDEVADAACGLDDAIAHADDAAQRADEVVEGAVCTLNSFTPQTLVLLHDGRQTPIEDVRVGDLVLATDLDTGETAARPVTDLIVHGGIHTMVDVTLDDGTTIKATDRHPFWDASIGRFVDAIALEAGHQLRLSDGTFARIAYKRVYAEDVTAHNLTVAGMHTYYAGVTPVLVHNASCGEINRDIRAGDAPKRLQRADVGNTNTKTQDHVHLTTRGPKGGKDVGAVNRDGTGHDGPLPDLRPSEITYLRKKGWNV